ncbi:hypothetical protein RHCRD62_40564 [Rhodococcus sp. RD6.2]|nr:hypothetical protein RHCRD62_40564 [Rhodococcus sp. RD6.2]
MVTRQILTMTQLLPKRDHCEGRHPPNRRTHRSDHDAIASDNRISAYTRPFPGADSLASWQRHRGS